MPALGFTDQRERLRRILGNALQDATFLASRSEDDGRIVVIEAQRSDGRRIGVRLRGVSKSAASETPVAGSALSLRRVSPPPSSLLRFLTPVLLRGPERGYARVRIDAGSAHLDISCEDAEWWEEDAGKA